MSEMAMAMNTETFRDASVSDLKENIVGHRITDVNVRDGIITLDDGTVLEFESASECCAWYDVEIAPHMDINDNMVTDVVTVFDDDSNDDNTDDDNLDHYALRVLSRDKAILDVNVDGDPTSGYYCQSFTLNVKTRR